MQVSFRQLCDSAFTARRYAHSLTHSLVVAQPARAVASLHHHAGDIDRQRRAAGLLLSAVPRQETSIDSGGRPAAAAPQHGAEQQIALSSKCEQ